MGQELGKSSSDCGGEKSRQVGDLSNRRGALYLNVHPERSTSNDIEVANKSKRRMPLPLA